MATKAATGEGPDLKALKQNLKEGKLEQLYIFHGEEAYLRDYYLEQVKKKILPAGMEDFNLHEFHGKDCEPKALSQAVDCLPMMAERTLILAHDYDLFKAPADQRDAMTELFQDLPEYVCLIFVCDIAPYQPDARTKLAGAIKKCGLAVKFARQDQNNLVDWVCRRFRAQEKQIDTETARYLIFLCGDLMHSLIGEIEKISAYTKSSMITREDIDKVAIPQLDAVVFQMTDAITAGNFDKAAHVLADLLHMGESGIMITAVLGKQLRQLYTARLAYEQRKNAGYLAQLWSMRSSYPAQKLMDAARRYDLDWCRMAVGEAYSIDLAMKSVNGSDEKDLLVDLLLKLANSRPRR